MISIMSGDASRIGDQECLIETVHRLIGAEAARRVQHVFGGTYRYVPKRPQIGHWLVQLCGEVGALAVAAELGGATIAIPKGRKDAERFERDHHILLLVLAGLPVLVASMIFDLHVRQILRVLKLAASEALLPPGFFEQRKNTVIGLRRG